MNFEIMFNDMTVKYKNEVINEIKISHDIDNVYFDLNLSMHENEKINATSISKNDLNDFCMNNMLNVTCVPENKLYGCVNTYNVESNFNCRVNEINKCLKLELNSCNNAGRINGVKRVLYSNVKLNASSKSKPVFRLNFSISVIYVVIELFAMILMYLKFQLSNIYFYINQYNLICRVKIRIR